MSVTIDRNLPYLGKNRSTCCQEAERASGAGVRWLQCSNCNRVLVNIDGHRSAPAMVELALFDLEPTGSRQEQT